MQNARYGRWTVLEKVRGRSNTRSTFYRCRCSCGNEKVVSETSLLNGKSKSCGCLKRELAEAWFEDYRLRKTAFNAWMHLQSKQLTNTSFPEFLETMGRPPSTSARVGVVNDKVCWKDSDKPLPQCLTLYYQGELKTVRRWARQYKNTAANILAGLRLGMPMEEAMGHVPQEGGVRHAR